MRMPALLLCVPAVALAQGSVKPMWVNQLPSEPGRIYAIGSALISPTEAMAIKKAGDNARGEVLARLRASVKSTTDMRSSSVVQRSTGSATTASSTQNFSQSTTVQAQALELPGLTVQETWTDRKDNTVWALAYLDAAVAQTELKTRFDAMTSELASENASGEPRERIRKLQRLKLAQAEMAKLDDTASLLTAAGGDPALRGEVRKTKLWVDKLLDELRASLTFSLGGDTDPNVVGDVASVLRNAVLKSGLGWAERDGEFTIQLKLKRSKAGLDIGAKKTYWDQQQTADFIITRGYLDLTLVDRAGTQYESTSIDAIGQGVDELSSERKLKKEFGTKIASALQKWLAELTK